jgi:alcohol dehydrogenase (cytochrome c)/quinohemoprotein ethanol dehydrogenase
VLNRARLLGLALLLPAFAGCAKKEAAVETSPLLANPAAVTQERLEKGASDGSQWPTYGGSYNEQRFSPLKAINSDNVKDLGLAWFADYDTNQDQQGAPLYIDGVIYVSTARNVVHAYDAKTGKQLWKYVPQLAGERLRYNLGFVNRGLAAWNGKIYMGTLDARLVAIDAKTGKEAWSTDTVPPSLGLGEMSNRYSIAMAPRVAKGKVFIGAGGGEFGVRGWIAAYDAETGKEAWRFWTVPGDPAKGFENAALEKAAKTWSGEWWKDGGGGTVWEAAVYDPTTDLLYFGTGNGAPWAANERAKGKGADNLYVASIIALKPDTGEYVWHFQATPGDAWDYDAVSPMMTADITIGGEQKHVLIQPNKNGFLYVLNAADGKFISADPFTEVNWAKGVDPKTGRPNVVPGARYEKETWNLAPGVQGGHAWHPNAYSPDTGLVYIPTWEAYFPMQLAPPAATATTGGGGGAFNLGIAFTAQVEPGKTKPYDREGIIGRLKAWDPVARKVVWETPPFKTDGRSGRPTGGVLATAGNLVFMGTGEGKELVAYDAKSGAPLWKFPTQTLIFAAPITYELDGVQYVAASVGGASKGNYFAPSYARMLVFRIGGKAVLPAPQPYTPPALDPPALTASADAVKLGSDKYSQYCSICHGAGGQQGRSSFPNLTVTPLLHTQEGFDSVVLGGVRTEKGMGSFSQYLKPEDTAAIRQYLVSVATELKARAQPAPVPAAPARDMHEQGN